MFDDPKKELERMEKKLLAAEDDDWLEKQLAEARMLIGDDVAAPKKRKHSSEGDIYRNYANGYGAGTPKREKVLYADEYEEEEDYPQEKGVRGLILLACLETLGIVAILAYWLVHLL